jgi:hypothetical protein
MVSVAAASITVTLLYGSLIHLMGGKKWKLLLAQNARSMGLPSLSPLYFWQLALSFGKTIASTM